MQWIQIAVELGTERTAAACLGRFHAVHADNIAKSAKWTPDEEDRLRAAVAKYGAGKWVVWPIPDCAD